MTTVTELQKEIRKTRQYLSRLEAHYLRLQSRKNGYSEKQRVQEVRHELLKKFPNMNLTPRDEGLLRLVGTLPYVPLEKEKQHIGRAFAAKYE